MEHKNEKSERAEKMLCEGWVPHIFFRASAKKKNKKVLNLTRTNIDDDDMVWEVAEEGRECGWEDAMAKILFFIKTKAAWQKKCI